MGKRGRRAKTKKKGHDSTEKRLSWAGWQEGHTEKYKLREKSAKGPENQCQGPIWRNVRTRATLWRQARSAEVQYRKFWDQQRVKSRVIVLRKCLGQQRVAFKGVSTRKMVLEKGKGLKDLGEERGYKYLRRNVQIPKSQYGPASR